MSAINIFHTENVSTTDVVVCVTGARPNLREITPILRSLWSAGIQCALVESNGPEEGQDMAKDLGAVYYVIFTEDGILRLRSWINDKFEERLLNREELITYIKRTLRPEPDAMATLNTSNNSSFNDSSRSNKSTILSGPTLPNYDVSFGALDKMPMSVRRRCENVITQQMTSTLMLFNKKEEIIVVAVDLPSNALGAVAGAIDPRGTNAKEISCEVAAILDRYPEYKRHIKLVTAEVIDIYLGKKNPPVICLYGLKDNCYRFIL